MTELDRDKIERERERGSELRGMRLVGRGREKGYFTTVGIFEPASVRRVLLFGRWWSGEVEGGDAARGSKLCRQTRSRIAVGVCCLVGEAVAC